MISPVLQDVRPRISLPPRTIRIQNHSHTAMRFVAQSLASSWHGASGRLLRNFPDLALTASTDFRIGLVRGLLLGLRRRLSCVLLTLAFFDNLALTLFDEGREFDRAIIRYFDVRRGPANAHRGDR